jgi:hypothetical protein
VLYVGGFSDFASEFVPSLLFCSRKFEWVRGGVSRISWATSGKWSDVTVGPMKVCGSTWGMRFSEITMWSSIEPAICVVFRFSRRYIGSSLINFKKVLPFTLEEVSPKSVCLALKSRIEKVMLRAVLWAGCSKRLKL